MFVTHSSKSMYNVVRYKVHIIIIFRIIRIMTYREKRNRINNFLRAPYMVLVVGRISTVTSLSYKQRGMAAKLI